MAAATLDFNDLLPADYVETMVLEAPVAEDGYSLTATGFGAVFYSYGSEYAADDVVAYDGPGVITNPNPLTGRNQLTRLDGQAFDMASIKLDYVTPVFLGGFTTPAVVAFTGQKADGTAVTTVLTTDLAPGLQTFAFGPEFAGVSSVTWTVENTAEFPFEGSVGVAFQQNQFDDIVVDDGAPPPPPPPPPPEGATATVGSGPDTLALRITQDAYQGSAQFTVSVDGVRIGGTLTATALRGSGQSDTVNVLGDWSAGGHTATVDFLNDAWGGTAATDRNLYVEGAAYNGAEVPDAARALLPAGPASFGFTEAGAPPPPPPPPPPPMGGSTTTVGTGSDALVLRITQDAYQGSAQYTVSVDGVQIGGALTATALRGSGQSDTLTVQGEFAAGGHTATVDFLNDAWGGTPSTDRNLYVESAAYNGAAVADAARSLLSAGPASFGFTEAGAPPPPGGSSVTLGSGSDALVVRIAQDAYQGSAQYTVSLDGTQLGGVQTATALRGSGAADILTVRGEFAPGSSHTLTVDFLNDAWGGTPSTDRNLYVEGAAYNGAEVPGAARALLPAGPASFGFTETSPIG